MIIKNDEMEIIDSKGGRGLMSANFGVVLLIKKGATQQNESN